MPTITVPKSFFVNERRMYSDWLEAFWREFFQNSIDAGATRIDVMTEDLFDKNIRITFTDNGCGMSRETLENVYFKLGASSKNDDSSIGGFGRARILTCFSMKNYEIRSRNNLVIGDGGTYDITDCEYVDGTQVIVNMEDEWYFTVIQALHNYLRLSQMQCKVYLNDVPWTDWTQKRKLTRHLERDEVAFADVYVNKSGRKNSMLVRVAGVLMYAQWINATAEVIVEIDPKLSRQVLTANRDGMQSSYQSVLNRFTQELASETLSALQPKFTRRNATIRGSGMLVSRKAVPLRNDEETATSEVAQEAVAQGVSLAVAEVIGPTSDIPRVSSTAPKVADEPTAMRSRLNLPDVIIYDETDNPKIRRVIENYNPLNWSETEISGKMVNRGATMMKILLYWKLACQEAIDALLDMSDTKEIAWAIGWLFSDTAIGRNMKITGGHALLLNPVSNEGTLDYFVSSNASKKKLMAIAKHEVAHIAEQMHNENFAKVLTHIDMAYDEKQVYRQMREIEV